MGMYKEFIEEDHLESRRMRKERVMYARQEMFRHIEGILGESIFNHELVRGNPVIEKEIRAAGNLEQVVAVLVREKRHKKLFLRVSR